MCAGGLDLNMAGWRKKQAPDDEILPGSYSEAAGSPIGRGLRKGDEKRGRQDNQPFSYRMSW